jgi:hypothetical protein
MRIAYFIMLYKNKPTSFKKGTGNRYIVALLNIEPLVSIICGETTKELAMTRHVSTKF